MRSSISRWIPLCRGLKMIDNNFFVGLHSGGARQIALVARLCVPPSDFTLISFYSRGFVFLVLEISLFTKRFRKFKNERYTSRPGGTWWLFISTLRFGDSTRCASSHRLRTLLLIFLYVKWTRIELRNTQKKSSDYNEIQQIFIYKKWNNDTKSWAL